LAQTFPLKNFCNTSRVLLPHWGQANKTVLSTYRSSGRHLQMQPSSQHMEKTSSLAGLPPGERRARLVAAALNTPGDIARFNNKRAFQHTA